MPVRKISALPLRPRSADATAAMMNRAVAWLAGMIAAFALLTCVAAANPPGHPVRIGVLGVEAPSFDPAENAFARELVEGLRQLGYTKGRDYVFEYRSSLGQPEAWPAIIREVLATKVDMVVAPLTQPALEAANATSTVPIVMVGTADRLRPASSRGSPNRAGT